MNYTVDQMRDFRERMNREYRFNMSEFVEIGDCIFRRSDISRVTEIKTGCVVLFVDGKTGRFSDSYESVRDKLLGKPPKPRVDDRRAEFVEQLMSHFRSECLFAAANRINAFYQSTMLSETEGAE